MKVISQKDWYEEFGFVLEVIEAAECRANRKIGQKFLIDDYTSPAGLCIETLHAIYPLLFSMRLGVDMQKFGSDEKDIRIIKCPTNVIKFKIERFHQCNNCGKKTESDELFDRIKKYEKFDLTVKVCKNCSKKLSEK